MSSLKICYGERPHASSSKEGSMPHYSYTSQARGHCIVGECEWNTGFLAKFLENTVRSPINKQRTVVHIAM